MPHNHVDFAYILTSATDDVRPPEEGESQEFRWLNEEEVAAFTETTPTIIDRCRYALSYVALKGGEK